MTRGMIKYLGSKRALLTHILSAIADAVPSGARVLDLFSGTARVGHALKGAGYRVVANDHNAYAHCLATCYVQADAERWAETARRILDDLARLPGRAGLVHRDLLRGAAATSTPATAPASRRSAMASPPSAPSRSWRRSC